MASYSGMAPLLSVFDMPRAVSFYCDTLGFEIVSRSPDVETREGRFFHWCLMRRDGIELMLNTAYDSDERPAEIDAPRWQGHGDTCIYIGCPEVDALYAELTDKGLDLKPPSTAHYGWRQLYLSDPDGYGLCFQWPAA